jgi:hypothetical protein
MADEHTKVYIEELDVELFDHSIVVESIRELAHLFSAAAELGGGGYYPNRNATLIHESQHADAAKRLGQRDVRFLARLDISAPYLHYGGNYARRIGILPSVIQENVRTSRLGTAMFLGFPDDNDTAAGSSDTEKIKSLGYVDANEVIKRAAAFNAQTRSDTYPLPRRAG